jgi:hypothetical protein
MVLSRYLLDSQDRHEIWLTFASFKTECVDYLLGNYDGKYAFLTMKERDPFRTNSAREMDIFSQIIVDFCMKTNPA